MNELTLLQFYGKRMGVKINRTPKCHPELAGEGIEYLWAIAKLLYRRTEIEKKRNKQLFHTLVKEVTNPSSSLNIQRVRACSKKAREYMVLYKVVKDIEINNTTQTNNRHAIFEKSVKMFNQMTKKRRTHRNVINVHNVEVLDIMQQTFSKPSGDDNKDIVNLIVKKMRCFKQENE